MSDLISRQDAIEAVRKVWCDNDDRKDFKQRYYEMGNNDAVEDAIGYIDALPSAEPETKCIAQIRIDRDDMEDLVNEAANEIVDKMEEPKTGRDCTDFVRWLMDEVMDEENWQWNAVANGEIICRKLKKLGMLDVVDGYYVETQETGWIPIKWHEITEEEREREGYPKDWVVHIDCDMPCDGDEILVQTKNGYIRWDVCYTDGELSLDSGWDWIEDIVAWMPLPEPWKDGDEE